MNLNTSNQQELITTKLVGNGSSVSSVDTDDYSLRYYGFLTLGNTNDTVTITLNGITGLEFSMIGMIECPIDTITLETTYDSNNNSVTRGLLVFGVKRYKKIF
jgi:hypothetical protein